MDSRLSIVPQYINATQKIITERQKTKLKIVFYGWL